MFGVPVPSLGMGFSSVHPPFPLGVLHPQLLEMDMLSLPSLKASRTHMVPRFLDRDFRIGYYDTFVLNSTLRYVVQKHKICYFQNGPFE